MDVRELVGSPNELVIFTGHKVLEFAEMLRLEPMFSEELEFIRAAPWIIGIPTRVGSPNHLSASGYRLGHFAKRTWWCGL